MAARTAFLSILITVAMLLSIGCHAAAFGRNGTLKPPNFERLSPPGGVVTGFAIRIGCAGVSSIRNVPDGWSFSADASGESYVVHVERVAAEAWLGKLGIPDRKASNRRIETIRLDVIYRGPWSDCIGARAVVHLKLPQAGGGWKDSEVWLQASPEEDWKPDPDPVKFEQ